MTALRDLFRTPAGSRPDPVQPPSGKPLRQVYVTWTPFQRRAESMRQYLGFDLVHIPPPFFPRWLKPFGYLVQAARTVRVVRAARPDVVWVQSPPSFLPHLMLAQRAVTRRFRIVVDAHNRSFAPPWLRFPAAVGAMNRCELVLVHNAEVRVQAEGAGVATARLQVLEDPPPLQPPPDVPALPGEQPYVLVPCSFQPDEPIPVLLAAARLAPELAFRVTGSRRRAGALGFTADPPANLRFTGYLPNEDFEQLLAGAAVVLGLTSLEGIQLSVANEALGAERALVLSDTRILRTLFGEAALLARNTPADLAAALTEAVARREELQARSAALKLRRQERFRAEADRVVRLLR